MKARASAVEELEAAGTLDQPLLGGGGEDDLDRQLRELSSGSEVDAEMAKMKAEIGGGEPAAAELPSGDEPVADAEPADAEQS
jgi:phage shock protein A